MSNRSILIDTNQYRSILIEWSSTHPLPPSISTSNSTHSNLDPRLTHYWSRMADWCHSVPIDDNLSTDWCLSQPSRLLLLASDRPKRSNFRSEALFLAQIVASQFGRKACFISTSKEKANKLGVGVGNKSGDLSNFTMKEVLQFGV